MVVQQELYTVQAAQRTALHESSESPNRSTVDPISVIALVYQILDLINHKLQNGSTISTVTIRLFPTPCHVDHCFQILVLHVDISSSRQKQRNRFLSSCRYGTHKRRISRLHRKEKDGNKLHLARLPESLEWKGGIALVPYFWRRRPSGEECVCHRRESTLSL